MTTSHVEVVNCNNIDQARLMLRHNKLNIKYAANGTGKSTIGGALARAIQGDSLGDYTPFKYRSVSTAEVPAVMGIDEFQSVKYFDEKYLRDFVFKEDEVVTGSYEIFIKSKSYREKEAEFNELVQEIRSTFSNHDGLEAILTALERMNNSFKLNKDDTLSQQSSGFKALKKGNLIANIPASLLDYEGFIASDARVEWIGWHQQGVNKYWSDRCPFCSQVTDTQKDRIQELGEVFDKSTIKHLTDILNTFSELGDFLSEDYHRGFEQIKTASSGLTIEQAEFIVGVQKQIQTLINCLKKLQEIEMAEFRETIKIAEVLGKLVVNLDLFPALNSPKTQASIEPLNEALEKLLKRAGPLQGVINIARKEANGRVTKCLSEINEFLSQAGYRYLVEAEHIEGQVRLYLRHVDNSEKVKGGTQHLSYGEKNAFALVLFMYDCLASNPDLIILDDPISSFDSNKKFAVLDRLFGRDTDSCFRGSTVLLLTHDIEPVLDLCKTMKRKYQNHVRADFLRWEAGQIRETEIAHSDFQTFNEICTEVLESSGPVVVKLIYLRRLLELSEKNGHGYQVVSNLLHGRSTPLDRRSVPEARMDSAQLDAGMDIITQRLKDERTYEEFLNLCVDREALLNLYRTASNGYEKLQLFRMLINEVESPLHQKFINETYHIENEYIFQLSPTKFDTVPSFIVQQCDDLLAQRAETPAASQPTAHAPTTAEQLTLFGPPLSSLETT